MIRVTAERGALPADTVVRVTYGAGEEEYALLKPQAPREVMFCSVLREASPDAQTSFDASSEDAAGMGGLGAGPSDAGPRDAGPRDGGQGAAMAVRCELWTGGAATVDVMASGYPVLQSELEAEADECGIVTRDVDLVLTMDGGSSDAG